MRNEAMWRPTKYVEHRGGWRGNRDTNHLSRASRVTADRAGGAYAAALRAHARGDLLDLGAGAAPAYGMYRPHVESVTCVDWSSSVHTTDHLDIEADLREPLPFADESYDTVVLTDVLEHMPYPDRLVGEIARVLRPGGSVVIGVPFMYGIHEAPHDHHRYTQFQLRLLCEDNGLEVVELAPYGGPAAVLLDLASKALASVRPLRWAAGLPAVLAARGGRPLADTPLPLGYVVVARRGG